MLRKFDVVIAVAIIAIALRFASPSAAHASFFVLAALALLGPSEAIQALALSWFLSMVNPALAPDLGSTAVGRYAIIAAAATSIGTRLVVRREFREVSKLTAATLLFVLFIVLHALVVSDYVDVSLLKAITWCAVLLTLIASWQNLSPVDRVALSHRLENALVFFVIASATLLLFPQYGYYRNGYGFQGFLDHPQAFGPVAALAAALMGGRLLSSDKRNGRVAILFVLCVGLTLASKARTAGLAVVAGLFLTAVLLPVVSGVSRRKILPGLSSRRVALLTLIAIPITLISAPYLEDAALEYALKGSEGNSLLDAAEASRGRLVESMVTNIREHPWTGIGFGVASTTDGFIIERDPIFGFPLSAPVEKGVMFLAVFEELGIFGGLSFCAWVAFFVRSGARAGAVSFAVMLTVLLINLGENVFFSVGGLGMLLIVFFSGAACARTESRQS